MQQQNIKTTRIVCHNSNAIEEVMETGQPYRVFHPYGPPIKFEINDETGELETKTLKAQVAEHFAKIPVYEVEGYPRAKTPPAPVKDFIEEGLRQLALKKQREAGNMIVAPPVMPTGFGGGSLLEQLRASMTEEQWTNFVTTQLLAAAKSEFKQQQERIEEVNIEKANPALKGDRFSFVELKKWLSEDDAYMLIREFMPHLQVDAMNFTQQIKEIVTFAESSAILRDRLDSLASQQG